MFTGIITDMGRIRRVSADGDTRLEIATGYDTAGLSIGASVACSGVCLTVIETGADWFAITASAETLERTTLGGWQPGTAVNLERALRLGDELGGHIVSGHVDGVATLATVVEDGASRQMTFEAPERLARFIAEKGSVAVDGVSLTVNTVEGVRFSVNIIPHTLAVTTLGTARVGGRVNLEIDMLARYVARLLEG